MKALALLALVACAAGCATAYDPYRIPKRELHQRVSTIALAPPRIWIDVANPPELRERIEERVRQVLVGGGFAVVPSSVFDERWRAIAMAMGGIWDPVSGKRDDERYELVEEHVYRELIERHRIDAILYVNVHAVDLYLQHRDASFCGTTGPVYWHEPLGFTESPSLVFAACLGVALFDTSETLVYEIRSGLETIETYHDQTRRKRPLDERLRDDARLQQAVSETLGKLVEGRR